jgi:predicted AAA+ superfamily ATPase
MTNVSINVTGPAACGKTTITNLIAQCLAEHGITNVTINCPDLDGYPIEHLDKCTQALIDKDISITINDIQIARIPQSQ